MRAQARRQAPDLAVYGVASHCEHLGLLSALASSGASNGAGVAIGRPLSSILIMRGIKIHFPLLRSKQPIRDGYAGFSVDAASRLVRHGWPASSPVLLRAAEGWVARPSATSAKEVHRTTLGERPPVGSGRGRGIRGWSPWPSFLSGRSRPRCFTGAVVRVRPARGCRPSRSITRSGDLRDACAPHLMRHSLALLRPSGDVRERGGTQPRNDRGHL